MPNISGRLFPKHERWLSYLPAEASVWTPSLYMGFLPVLWGVTQLRWFGGRRRVRWLTWIATFFAIGSLGWFGGGWFVREFAHSVLGWDTTEWWLGQPTGGLYWLLVVAVPGYVQFRYPAKLWTLVAFALACLAATGFDHGWRLGKRNSLLAYSAIAACCAGIVAYLLAPGIFARGNFGPDDLWGPFQVETAAWRLVQSCSHTALIASVGWLIFRSKVRPPRAAWLCVFVVLADMYVANAWLLPTIPASRLAPPRNMDTAAGITRVDPGNWRNDFPPQFRTVSSADRVQDALRYDRERGYGRLHLLDGVGSLRPYTTFVPADYDLWQQVGGRLQFPTRVWSVNEVTTLPPLSAADERQLTVRRARVVRIVKALGNNPTQVAVLESPAASEEQLTPASSVQLLAERGGELRIKYTATATARLVINITYDPGWQATLISNGKSQPIPVQRANRLMCSVLVPAGEQELHLNYQPREFTLGAILSGSSWLVWLLVLFTLRRQAISSTRL
jgi:hypothetical protein